MADVYGKFIINGHDYTQYLKMKTGLAWTRENTNDSDAGRDEGDVMHTNVRSHQRKLSITLGPMPFSVCQQLEADLEGGDNGVLVEYPDLLDGMCKRLFYNTSIDAAIERFTEDGIQVDNIKFNLISVQEETM